ncbi:hypothetical protein [Metaclostridioides mangenotii]|uniref:Uncharacterized protein n=1 Tax=Metaclostridioides mangenotii TaxID=1540 RepID=A0ABS4E9R9_9FIRM|nr:hypothetical protein [Clostridioides mangenotii]MBP1854679.1 hypothetical protein [Clostridioides mangenotii]
MIVKLEDRQALIDLARVYWLDEGFNILEALIKAERDLEGEYD